MPDIKTTPMTFTTPKTVTRYGVSIEDKTGAVHYLAGIVQNTRRLTWAGVYTAVCEDACTWGSEATAKVMAAAVNKSGFYGATAVVITVEEPTYNV